MKYKAEKVRELMKDCLHGKAEGALVVQGIIRTFGLSPEKIAAHREEIRELLEDMPNEFQASGGGGWSFLNLCMDKEGEQWTGFQQTMEELVVLGIAAGMAEYQLPREAWGSLPGGVPYVTFNTKAPHG